MTGDNDGFSRRRLLAGLGTAGAAALAGCSAMAQTPPGPHFRVGTLQPPVTLDPIKAEYTGSKQAINRIFDGLYTYREGTDITPQIATEQPIVRKNGQQVDVKIDTRARFQNGRPVTAADVQYSFEAPIAEGTATAWEVDMIESVDIVDDHTVRFHLQHQYPAFSHALTRAIVPKESREANKETFAKKPIGSGPFEVRKFSEGKKAQLVRWGEYWDKPKPAIAELTLVYVESPLTQMMSLRTKRNDAIEPIGPQVANDIRGVTGASVKRQKGFTTFYLGFNLNEGPTTEPEIREAISYCIDFDEAVEKFIEPLGDRVYSPLPRQVARDWSMPIERWEEAPNRKNTERARHLFREADKKTGQLTILTSKDPKWKELGEALAGGLRNAGHGALVASKPWPKYLEKYVSGSASDYSIFIGEITGTPDPDSFLYPTFHENMAGETNGVFYKGDDVMNRLSKARSITDRARRQTLYETAITKLLSERVFLPICSFENSFAVADQVQNFQVHPITEVNPRVTSDGRVVRINS